MFNPDLIAQLTQLKNATDSGMEKLPAHLVEGSSGNGLIKLKMNGMYELKELHIATDLQHMEKEDLEDYLVLALNDAVAQVTKLREEELTKSLTELIQKR